MKSLLVLLLVVAAVYADEEQVKVVEDVVAAVPVDDSADDLVVAEDVLREDFVVAPAEVKEDAELSKPVEIPQYHESDIEPMSKDPNDPCRKIRELTSRLRELGAEMARKTTELVRVRGDERTQVRKQITGLREEVTKTNQLIRENTRDCARSRRPTLRPQPVIAGQEQGVAAVAT